MLLKMLFKVAINPLSANPTIWSNRIKIEFFSVFDQFVGLALKGLKADVKNRFYDSKEKRIFLVLPNLQK